MKNETVDVYLERNEMIEAYGWEIVEWSNGQTTSSAPYFLIIYNGVTLKAYQDYRCTVAELEAAVLLAYKDHLEGRKYYLTGQQTLINVTLAQLESEIRKFRGPRKDVWLLSKKM